jgi:hypothetical protein
VETRTTVQPLRHRQTKGAVTDMLGLKFTAPHSYSTSFLSAAAKLDCFANARNDDLRLFFRGCLKSESEIHTARRFAQRRPCAVPTILESERWWARHRLARSRDPLALSTLRLRQRKRGWPGHLREDARSLSSGAQSRDPLPGHDENEILARMFRKCVGNQEVG